MAIIMTLTIATAALWGYLIGSLIPHVSSTNDQAVEAICSHSRIISEPTWYDACEMAQSASGIIYEGEK